MDASLAPRRTLTSVRRDFDRWRARRATGARIPPELWEVAVALVADHGISQTARALGLDYYALKKHVDADRPSTPAFVEVTMSGLGPVSECQLELADERGTRLRVALRGAAVAQAAELVRVLWSEVRR